MIQVIQVPTPPVPPEIVIQAPQLPPGVIIQGGPPHDVLIAISVIVLAIVAGFVLWPLVRALAKRIESRAVDPGLQNEVGQLRARVGELEELHARLAELEERVDFSERLLTRGQPQPVERQAGL